MIETIAISDLFGSEHIRDENFRRRSLQMTLPDNIPHNALIIKSLPSCILDGVYNPLQPVTIQMELQSQQPRSTPSLTIAEKRVVPMSFDYGNERDYLRCISDQYRKVVSKWNDILGKLEPIYDDIEQYIKNEKHNINGNHTVRSNNNSPVTYFCDGVLFDTIKTLIDSYTTLFKNRIDGRININQFLAFIDFDKSILCDDSTITLEIFGTVNSRLLYRAAKEDEFTAPTHIKIYYKDTERHRKGTVFLLGKGENTIQIDTLNTGKIQNPYFGIPIV